MNNKDMAAILREIADELDWDTMERLNEVAAALDNLHVTLIHKDEEYSDSEVLTSFPMPVRRVRIDYFKQRYSDSGFITPLGPVGFELEEQNEIVQAYLDGTDELFEKVSDEVFDFDYQEDEGEDDNE